ncbi:MAG: F0F1 ATP synthase subunit epsilon [Planctomycetota bacterium]
MVLRVHFITPRGFAYVQQTGHLVLPAFDGEVGILPGHAPFVCLLGYGRCRLDQQGGDPEYVALRGGVAWIQRNQVAVVTESLLRAREIRPRRVLRQLAELDAATYDDTPALATAHTEARWLIAQLHCVHEPVPRLRQVDPDLG